MRGCKCKLFFDKKALVEARTRKVGDTRQADEKPVASADRPIRITPKPPLRKDKESPTHSKSPEWFSLSKRRVYAARLRVPRCIVLLFFFFFGPPQRVDSPRYLEHCLLPFFLFPVIIAKQKRKGVPSAGLEPATPRLEVWCSIH